MMLVLFTSCAQKQIAIKTERAFFTVSSPGNPMVSETGEVIPKFEVERYLFVELDASDILKIKSVTANNQKFTTRIEKIEGASIIVGSSFLNNSQKKISAQPGKTLWKVWLLSVYEKPITVPLKNIIVTGMAGNKPFVFKYEKETELQGPMRY